MEFTGSQVIAASREQVWKGLNDPAVLHECIPGCEAFNAESDDEFRAVVVASVAVCAAVSVSVMVNVVVRDWPGATW